MIKRDQGKTKTMYFLKAGTTAFTDGYFVSFTGGTAGTVTPSTSSSSKILGVGRRTVASTDTDYTQNTMYPVQVPIENYVTWYADATAGTLATMQGVVGTTMDLTDGGHINTAATSENVVLLIQVISTTSVIVCIAAAARYA